jgi:hypothetical protein
MSRSGNSVAECHRHVNYKPLACIDAVSEGGLEPLAYITAAGTDHWLSV